MRYYAKKEEDLKEISRKVVELFEHHNIFALKGEMGVGKTTFISYLAKEMGIKDKISSPTYGYMKEYESQKYGVIYHFDLYRISDELEAYDIGIEEYIYYGYIVFIEWAENIANLLEEDCVWITITKEEDGTRVFDIKL